MTVRSSDMTVRSSESTTTSPGYLMCAGIAIYSLGLMLFSPGTVWGQQIVGSCQGGKSSTTVPGDCSSKAACQGKQQGDPINNQIAPLVCSGNGQQYGLNGIVSFVFNTGVGCVASTNPTASCTECTNGKSQGSILCYQWYPLNSAGQVIGLPQGVTCDEYISLPNGKACY